MTKSVDDGVIGEENKNDEVNVLRKTNERNKYPYTSSGASMIYIVCDCVLQDK